MVVEAPGLPPSPYVITVSSDEGEEEDDVQMLEFHKQTQSLIDKPAPKIVKKLSEAECPICFDSIVSATTTSCGHLFCLECLQKSISASAARGQTRRAKGVGLCPMCRESVLFKDAIVLRLKKQIPYSPFEEEAHEDEDKSIGNEIDINQHDEDDEFLDDDLAGLF